MTEEIEVSKQWIAKAKNDLLNVDNNLKAEEIPFDTVCFHCQQAVEKLLKAYLVANSNSYPITHDLILLLEKIIILNASAEVLRNDLALLMPYHMLRHGFKMLCRRFLLNHQNQKMMVWDKRGHGTFSFI